MLHSISPVDGRYKNKTSKLAPYFSEYALIKYRVLVEIEYLIALGKLNLQQLSGLEAQTLFLRSLVEDFSEEDALTIKHIEKTTNHDVKAVEYFLREKCIQSGNEKYVEFIHFGLTSQDINNTAFPLMMKEANENIIIPEIMDVLSSIVELADRYPNVAMLAHTHGQAASPTSFKKEMSVFSERLNIQVHTLGTTVFKAKFGGATGNLNAHKLTFPEIDWPNFCAQFIQGLGLERLRTTTQISHYDNEAAYFHNLIRINNVLIDFCKDMWTYISMDYIKQKAVQNEVGSSAMPHKVNPIDFENAEGNLLISNALLGFLAEKLPISRLQRDLTDSTVLRNVGVPLAHLIIATQSIVKGMSKLNLNEDKINKDLGENLIVIAEGIQSILRREGCQHPYELLKNFTRGKSGVSHEEFLVFIDQLPVNEKVKVELKSLSPYNYTGYSE